MFKRFKNFAGAKEFSFKDPDTGFKYVAKDQANLLRHIETYRRQNDLPPIEYLPQVVENYLCSLPIHVGHCTKMPALKRSVYQYLQGGIALLRNVAYQKFVTQEEADRRSTVCRTCPKNEFPDRKALGFIKWSNDLAVDSVGERRSIYHNDLGVCAICSCPLKAKVWYDGVIKLTQAEVDAMRPLNCWQPPLAQITKQNKKVTDT